jgi:hypothetical protein
LIVARSHAHRVRRLVLAPLSALTAALLLLAPFVPAHAQTQIVTATPGYINLGMTTAISVTAPSAGAYTVAVVNPSGKSTTLPFTFTAAGATQNATFGVAGSGFGGVVNAVGTYNVFVEQAGQVVGSTSFYATNKLVITSNVVVGGTCSYVPGVARGEKLIPRFYVSYASNGAPVTNATLSGLTVTTPSKTNATASWDSAAGLFDFSILPNWNYTDVGNYAPSAAGTDAFGNIGTYTYSGSPYTIAPAQLSTSVQLIDTKTNQTVTSIYSGETVTVSATITYPTNAEPVKGFVGPLDSATRGGVVKAEVGYGYFNATTDTFGGSSNNPGTLLGTVAMTYSGANGVWTGQYTASSLPNLPAGGTYQVVVTSSDKASPPNTGMGSLSVGTSTAPATTLTSTTTVSLGFQSVSAVSYSLMLMLLVVGVIIGVLLKRRL